MATEPRTGEQVWVTCPVCDGQNVAALIDTDCPECDGAGGFHATLLPLAGGQMLVVEKEAWEKAKTVLALAIIHGGGNKPSDEWCHTALAEFLLPPIFPDGVLMAEAIGTVCLGETRSGPTVILDDGEDSQLIGGRQVAVLLEKRPHD